MHLRLERVRSNADSTLGLLFIDTKFFCFVAEDAFHDIKQFGKTRIPQGNYALKLKAPGSSKFDPSYTHEFGLTWHLGMLELQNVPNYSGVLIHIGNTAIDTDGCLLVGLGANLITDHNDSFQVTSSKPAYIALYPLVRDQLRAGNAVDIEIIDLDR